jgi:23S rRNA pseudouridine1911/1915/1917 synthase
MRTFGGDSWSEAERSIASRHVRVNGTLCVDAARRLQAGEKIEIADRPLPPVPREQDVRALHVDADLVVVDKPAGILSLRRGEERHWSEERKDHQPTLDELLAKMLPGRRIRPVHRLDRDTSGLMLYALSARGETELIRLFARHQIERTYLAIALGRLNACTISSTLVRDRGDGLRGSRPNSQSSLGDAGQKAVTHFRPIEHIGDAYTLVECRLETGRTHQIRIHLSEMGHMMCGEKIYTRLAPNSPAVEDISAAPRQALHSTEMRFEHPFTGRPVHFRSPLAADLMRLLEGLRDQRGKSRV